MSSEESENCEKHEEKKAKKSKFAVEKIKTIRKFEQEEVFVYIEKLHELLKKKAKKLKKYKDKIKKLVKQVDRLKVGQTESQSKPAAAAPAPVDKKPETTNQDPAADPAPLSLVDEIRQAAEQAQNLNGFVFEPTSGLYYDQKTGYYYNAEYGLYYDGNTGCYYKYNQEKNSFEFHSQVQVPEAAATKASDSDIFENYTVVADDDNEEWGVISDRPRMNRKQAKIKTRHKTNKDKRSPRQRHRHHKRRRHSTSSPSDTSEREEKSRRRRDKKSDRTEDREKDVDHDDDHDEDMEDGELESSPSRTSSSSDSSCDSGQSTSDAEERSLEIFNRGSHFQDIAKKYPPSLRIIVQESQLEELKVGSLSLITFKGGTLGREGKHDVIIPDLNVSKFHLKFTYDTKKYIYKCTDLGSRNGTILNGTRMSGSKVESDPHDLVHGSVLQIGQTKLLCHVHEGNSTCGQCEPGLLIEAPKEPTPAAPAVVLTHKEQLKKLQKKYGLENEKFVNNKQSVGKDYNDRAATRRIQVGSSTDKEKTQTSSVNTAISSENKGFKMLSKLGWSKGEALGKTTTGLLEPINVSSNEGKKGLGCDDNSPGVAVMSMTDKKKFATWKKTQERYQKADIFLDSDDDS